MGRRGIWVGVEREVEGMCKVVGMEREIGEGGKM